MSALMAASPEKRSYDVVAIGGGTGTSNLLRGLTHYVDKSRIAVITTSMDSGGNTQHFVRCGALPPGDFRQNTIPLVPEEIQTSYATVVNHRMGSPDFDAKDPEHRQLGHLLKIGLYEKLKSTKEVNRTLDELFSHKRGSERFEKWWYHEFTPELFEQGIEGFNLGNLMIAAAEWGFDRKSGIDFYHDLFDIQGRVIPVSLQYGTLVAKYSDGTVIKGEENIDTRGEKEYDPRVHITKLSSEPNLEANPDALDALLNTQKIIIGPGDWDTSVLPNLQPNGVVGTLRDTSASVELVTNLMTKPGETDHFVHASDFIHDLKKYAGTPRFPLHRVYINNADLSRETILVYRFAKRGQRQDPILPDQEECKLMLPEAEIVEDNFALTEPSTGFLRHDARKLARRILS
jgi:uncharacterized cofD-like protein